ncbi:hypothetical protein Tdes44962_MAKER06056 [Teratosphaeria destructans]|uniref:Uncharacterized protein n=1 Tax=Teratosphaeria destructans TaxID=418781 RepID=A0A9W7VYA0_9PEZI|nr:hypothetical protein Tdes44962_MAKER06056 [Teratosphaeria destructans]
MADDDYDGDEMMGFDDELDWLYVEDEYSLADELAETQIAEPGYAGTNYELSMEDFEFDLYAYHDDLEYGDDSYWEYGLRQDISQLETAGQKRKRGAHAKTAKMNKRRKVLGLLGTQAIALTVAGAEQPDPVLYMSQQERSRPRVPPVLEKRVGYALIGDWRRRFAGEEGITHTEEMPVDMQKASEAQDDDTPAKHRQEVPGEVMEDEEGEWEDEEDDDNGEVDLSALDPDILKQALKQKLKDAGLEGSDEGAFMDTLRRMLAGDEDAAAGELANNLLGHATEEEGGGAFSGWLSQQGVSLHRREDDEASSVAPEEDAEMGRGGKVDKKQHSSPDSAVSGFESSQACTKGMAVRGASPELNQKVAAAASREEYRGVTAQNPSDDATSRKPDAEHGASTVARRAGRNKATRAYVAKKNVTDSSGTRASPSEQLQGELQDDMELLGDQQSQESTRKRKAGAQDEIEGLKEQRAVKEPATRRTRGARGKVAS